MSHNWTRSRLICRLLLALLCALVAVTASGQERATRPAPAFNPALLSPAVNLLSNGSFEAQSRGLPRSFDLYSHPEYVRLTTDEARYGKHALLADVPAGGKTQVAGRQQVPACGKVLYKLTGWVKVLVARGGTVSLALAARNVNNRPLARQEVTFDGPVGSWQQLSVQLQAPAGTAWLTVYAPLTSGGVKVVYDALSLYVLRGPRRPVCGPPVTALRTEQVSADWVLLAWVSSPGRAQVWLHRAGWPGREWKMAGLAPGSTFTALELDPDTDYYFQVRPVLPEYYDENGQPARPPYQPRASLPFLVHTAKWQPRQWAGLRIWPTTHLKTFASDQKYPCIEAYKGFLYVVEAHGGGLHLSKVRPSDYSVIWTREVVAPHTHPTAFQGQTDTCVVGNRLYILYTFQETGNPAFKITDSREILLTYDLAEDKLVGKPYVIAPTRPDAGTWYGGVAAFRNQPWVVWTEVWEEKGSRHTRLLVAPFANGALGKPTIWQDAPSTYIYAPAVSVFAEELFITFSDMAALERRPGYEPLFAVRFDGLQFHGLRTLNDLGRNRYARGVEVGKNFYLLYRTDVPYMSYSGLYQDIYLAVLSALSPSLDATSYLGDMTYSTSPDVTAMGNSLYMVYEKQDHAFSDPQAPPHSYGTFIGRIDLGPVTTAQ